jgi:hypothetical protein
MKSDCNKQVIILTVITFCSFQCIKNMLIIDSLVVNFQLLPNCLKTVPIAILYGFKFVIAIGHFPSNQNCFNNYICNYSLCQLQNFWFFLFLVFLLFPFYVLLTILSLMFGWLYYENNFCVFSFYNDMIYFIFMPYFISRS